MAYFDKEGNIIATVKMTPVKFVDTIRSVFGVLSILDSDNRISVEELQHISHLMLDILPSSEEMEKIESIIKKHSQTLK